MSLLLVLVVLVAGVWFWQDTLRARELALARCRALCRELDVQLLDQSVGLTGIGFGRDASGRLRIRRWYGFEFSTTGADRRQGVAVVLGQRLDHLQMDHPDGPIVIYNGVARRLY